MLTVHHLNNDLHYIAVLLLLRLQGGVPLQPQQQDASQPLKVRTIAAESSKS